MPLRVFSLCSYLCAPQPWRNSDHVAHQFIKALKREKFGGYANVPVRGGFRQLRFSNAADADDIFGALAFDHLVWKLRELVLVPVPSSSSIVGSGQNFGPYRMATSLAKELTAAGIKMHVRDYLRWTQPLVPSHRGGCRDPEFLFPLLSFSGRPLKELKHVLVDDVFTLGGHIQACAAKLRERGASTIAAVCAGFTVHDAPADPWKIAPTDLADYDPDPF